MSPKPTLLIDGDIIAYKAAASTERATDWGDGQWTLHADLNEGIESMERQIAGIVEKLEGGECVFALSDGRSFRYDVYPEYKGNRKEVRKPLTLGALKQHLLDNYRTFLRPRLEGDDILGILMTSKTIIPGEKIQVSIDKDQMTVPGLLYNQKKDQLIEVTQHMADYFFMTQTLTGDPTDGYPGLPGCGPKKAAAILADAIDEGTPWANRDTLFRIMWSRVCDAYEKAGLTEEHALTQARCARLLHSTDYDFNKKEPILWKPPARLAASPQPASTSGSAPATPPKPRKSKPSGTTKESPASA